jgi:hypothetical protein
MAKVENGYAFIPTVVTPNNLEEILETKTGRPLKEARGAAIPRRYLVGMRELAGIAGGGNGRREASRLNKMLFGGDACDGRLGGRGKWEGAMRWACV